MAAKSMTQTEVVEYIADDTGEPKSVVKAVLMSEADLIAREMKMKGRNPGPGVYTFPYRGVKLENKLVPKRKARMGRNPATGEEIKIPAKPAHRKAKARVLKKGKDLMGL